MSQFDLTVDNQNFPSFRADMNAAWPALSSLQSGPSDPPSTVEFQYFADTTNDLLKRRNQGDTAFLPFDTLKDLRVETKTANYIHLLADMNRTILLDASSGNLTVNLLDAAVAQNGFVTRFKRIDSTTNTVLLDNFGGQTIDGVANLELIGENAEATVRSNGSNYFRESKVLGKPPPIISRIPIPYVQGQSFNSASFIRVLESEITDVSNLPVNFWNPSILTSGRVRLGFSINGSASVGFTAAFRIVENPNAAPVTVFESNAINIGDQSSNEFTTQSIDVSSGNVTNLDLTTTLLNNINTVVLGNATEWELLLSVAVGTGAYFIRGLEWQLLDY